jgi:hypothetical protein
LSAAFRETSALGSSVFKLRCGSSQHFSQRPSPFELVLFTLHVHTHRIAFFEGRFEELFPAIDVDCDVPAAPPHAKSQPIEAIGQVRVDR